MATKILNAAMFGLTPENMSSHEHLPSELDSSFLNTSTVIALCVFFALLCACIIIGHLLEENRWANESITALLLVSQLDSWLKNNGVFSLLCS